MNWISILIALLLVGAVALAIVCIRKKGGACSCGCDHCSGCPMAGSCHEKTK